MERKTIRLIIAVIAFVTEVLAIMKEKLNGRKGNDDQGAAKEK